MNKFEENNPAKLNEFLDRLNFPKEQIHIRYANIL
jgi:hypothetical protein